MKYRYSEIIRLHKLEIYLYESLQSGDIQMRSSAYPGLTCLHFI